MPAFRYKAVAADGTLRKGRLEAVDRRAVLRLLQRDGALPLVAEEETGLAALAEWLKFEPGGTSGAVSSKALASLTHELAMMLGAGEDLSRALQFVCEAAPDRRTREVMGRVREKVRGGSLLSAALAEQPGGFPELYIGLVRAGEVSGTLTENLERLSELLERQRSLSREIVSALIYPALLVMAAAGTMWLLIGYVLPQFVPLFQQSGVPLPFATRLLIGLGDGLARFGPWLLIAGLAAAAMLARLVRDRNYRLFLDRLPLRLPILGGLWREILAARFCRTLGTLLNNGMPLVAALGIVKGTLGNLAAAGAVETAILTVRGGGGLSLPLENAAIFPKRTTHLLRVGEETARLGPMCLKAAAIHEEQTRSGLQRLVALLVPCIILALGATVAGIIGSMLVAMLQLNDLAQ